MAIRDDFAFSQASLQDFLDCKRRFYYRYMERLSWPAIEAEPVMENERLMIRGANFHQLVEQYYLGIPADLLGKAAEAAQISRWWNNFIAAPPVSLEEKLFAEKLVTIPFADRWLVAKFDLIAKGADGAIRIFDWKTSRKRPQREYVATRMQTRVYPFVAAKVAKLLFLGEEVQPEKVKMIYWYAGFPDAPEKFVYSQANLDKDEVYLTERIGEVIHLEGLDDFPLTDNVNRCQFCSYRSLCDRGSQAGDLGHFDPEFSGTETIEIDFNEIDEIEF